MKKIFIFTYFTCCVFAAFAQNTTPSKTDLPKVFLLGENNDAYEKFHKQHATSLFEFCNNDTDQAFDKWARFLIAMEMYAESINYDVKGIKVWIEVCWDTNGKVKYIAYAPKPESRNTDLTELSGFMRSFVNNYQPQFEPGKMIVQNSQAFFPFLNR